MGITNTIDIAKKYHITLKEAAEYVEDWNLPFHVTGSQDTYLLESKTFEKAFIQNGLKPQTDHVKKKRLKERDDQRKRHYEQERMAIDSEKNSSKKKKMKMDFVSEYGGKGKIDYTKISWAERKEDIKKRRAANILKNRHTP